MEKDNTSTTKKLQIEPHNNNLLTVDMLMDGYKKYGIGWLQQTMDGLLAARRSKQFMSSLTEEQVIEHINKQRERLLGK